MVTTDEHENQLLLNCFTKWCQWAKIIIRVDKCVTFKIKKFSSRSLQFQPKLFKNTELLPVVNSGESFRYLGRYFNFEMDNDNHKVHLKSSLLDMINLIGSLCRPGGEQGKVPPTGKFMRPSGLGLFWGAE